jgi:hypothetical protein
MSNPVRTSKKLIMETLTQYELVSHIGLSDADKKRRIVATNGRSKEALEA